MNYLQKMDTKTKLLIDSHDKTDSSVVIVIIILN